MYYYNVKDKTKQTTVDTNLCIVAIGIFEIMMPPTGRLTLGIAQCARIISTYTFMQQLFRPASKLRPGWRSVSRALTSIRAIARTVVAERSRTQFHLTNKRRWNGSHRRRRHSSQGWRRMRSERRTWKIYIFDIRRRRHIEAIKILHFFVHGIYIEHLRRRNHDTISVMATSPFRFHRFNTTQKSFGAIAETFGSASSETICLVLVTRSSFLTGNSQPLKKIIISFNKAIINTISKIIFTGKLLKRFIKKKHLSLLVER